MGRIYRIPYSGTLTNAGGNADLLEVLPATNKPVRLLGWSIGQSSEVAEAQEENLRITVNRFPATVTSGNGTAVTPRPTTTSGAAAALTAECNGATVATTSGTAILLEEHAWNVRATPWEFWYPDPLVAPEFIAGEACIIRAESTPTDDISVAMTFWVEELG